VQKNGSPLFVYSEKTLRHKIREVRDAFQQRYHKACLAWSYKTNYLSAICAIMHQEGSWAEVVSEMEYQKARESGIDGDHIIFNGPHKPMPILRRAIAEKALINVDHFDEIDDIIAIAKERDEQVQVGIRLNLDAGIYPQWSRFGFNLESGQAYQAIQRMMDSGRIQVVGIHCHIGTYITDPQAYGRQVKKLVECALHIRQQYKIDIQYLDVGGGLPSRSRLKGSYQSPDVSLAPIDTYADALCNALHAYLPADLQPQLFLEPGRALVDEAGSLITSVINNKRLADGTQSYSIDAGVNLLYTAQWYQFNVATEKPLSGTPENAVLYGPLCMNIDVVRESIELPPLPRGSRLILAPVGAYNVTQWMQFIAFRPAIVLIDEQSTSHVIREAEDLTDITRRERLPDHLSDIRIVQN
ncbi:MAG: alanine racemase, partial [Planctomycetes bacterium]|nr:alanine racemase [Planctomycetota bacterium]